MKILELEQGSEEWIEVRRAHFCASEAPTVMGVNPYENVNKLAKKKRTGEKTFVTPAMRRGNDLEPLIREAVGKHLGIEFTPVVASEGLYLASLDGISEDGQTKLEIKAPSSLKSPILAAAEQLEAGYCKWQLVHQEMVWPTPVTYYAVLKPGNYQEVTMDDIILIPFGNNELRAEIPDLVEAWDKFAQMDVSEPVVRTDDEWVTTARSYRALKLKADMINAELKELSNAIKGMTEVDAEGAGVRVRQKKGSVSYKKIVDKSGIEYDPEEFRGKPTKAVEII